MCLVFDDKEEEEEESNRLFSGEKKEKN